ncbi:30S ribosomal protein S19e [Haloplanus rubicundus]|uniref:Small ribosomal subunit protein eS19 n=1 Tax=Haloplanus rubicundus TaxID=1547898 RepID=A0A345EAT6_9EURY|nr:30S ribosomal protein S19e [Haloplanus rubicundus]AXG09308.1 30S ribosomal protein S19e [Haloplanus rubicundus]
MVTLYDVPADALIDALADRLEDRIEAPDWINYAKTGVSKELPPQQDDFWATRAASLLRKVAVDGPVGVDRLSTAYGDHNQGSTRYRVAAAHADAGSKKIIRTALQQLEDEGLVSTAQGEGRVATPAGQSLLDEVAAEVLEDLDRPELEKYA